MKPLVALACFLVAGAVIPAAQTTDMPTLNTPDWHSQMNAITPCQPTVITPGCGNLENAPKPDPAPIEARIARRIDRYLNTIRSPMTGRALTRAGKEAGVNPFALTAIAVVESSAGRAACGRNAWGLGACGRAWTVITLCGHRWALTGVTSWYRGARLTGELLRCLWPRARTVHDLWGYCAGCGSWGWQVATVMRRMGSGPGVRWGDAVRAVR